MSPISDIVIKHFLLVKSKLSTLLRCFIKITLQENSVLIFGPCPEGSWSCILIEYLLVELFDRFNSGQFAQNTDKLLCYFHKRNSLSKHRKNIACMSLIT